MNKSFRQGCFFALAVTVFAAPAAEAQLTTLLSPACSAYDGFENQLGSVSYFQCGGAFAGNDANQDVSGWILNNWGFGVTLTGKTDAGAGGSGPFNAFADDQAAGRLTFDSAIYGDFVLALKAGNSFSLYHFVDADGWASIDYSTLGSGTNKHGAPQGLSHASIYSSGVSVPEPGAAMLLFAGIIGLGMVSRRRTRLID